MVSSSTDNPLRSGLVNHTVQAKVTDIDHFYGKAGMTVDTEYIIAVKCVAEGNKNAQGSVAFDEFKIGKKFKAFRELSSNIGKAASSAKKELKEKNQDPSATIDLIIKTAASIKRIIEAEKTRYLGKVAFNYVQDFAKKRQGIIDDVFDCMLTRFPANELENPHVAQFVATVEEFLLTDHIVDEGSMEFKFAKTQKNRQVSKVEASPTVASKKVAEKEGTNDKKPSGSTGTVASSVQPLTTKARKSVTFEAEDMKNKTFRLEDDRRPSELAVQQQRKIQVIKKKKPPTLLSKIMQQMDDPKIFALLLGAGVYTLRTLSDRSITIDTDVALFIAFICFGIGVNSPRLLVDKEGMEGTEVYSTIPARPNLANLRSREHARNLKSSATLLIKKSMMSSLASSINSAQLEELVEEAVDAEIEEGGVKSPMPFFPEGAKLGTVMNCWSIPESTVFPVRGPKYLTDKKKIPSGPFLFPARGVDLFLTDDCPEDVGRVPGAFGGKLREKPTFIINFRLPWAVLLCYFEIPEMYLPFLRKRYEPNSDDIKLPSTDKMTPGERTAARFLVGDDKHKDDTLKIVPVVVDGPWVVKSVVGGKPAIIGRKLPVNYVYHPADKKEGHAEYLEADLDIVASAAARRILSIVRGYTSVLTLDLGFVIQGNQNDELPEQMLVGARLHSVDPLTAPPLPPMPEGETIQIETDDGDESD